MRSSPRTIPPLLTAVLIIVVFVGTVLYGSVVEASFGRRADAASVLYDFVLAGGPVVYLLLLPLSVLALALTIDYALTIRRAKLLPPTAAEELRQLLSSLGPARLRSRLQGKTDLLSTAVAKTIDAQPESWSAAQDLLLDALQQRTESLLRRIEWLGLLGNICPMIGLFGTVLGMIKLFHGLAAVEGRPEMSRLADGLSVALVTTFWGLLIAIPALTAHSIFRNRIETCASEAYVQLERLASQLRAVLQSRTRSGIAARTASAAPSLAVKELSASTARKTNHSCHVPVDPKS